MCGRSQEDFMETYARQVIASSEKAVVLTRELLTTSIRTALHPSCVDLNRLVKEAEDTVRQLLGDTVQVQIVLTNDDPVVWSDPVQLRQVVAKLSDHAKEEMYDGGILRITTRTLQMADTVAELENPAQGCASLSFSWERMTGPSLPLWEGGNCPLQSKREDSRSNIRLASIRAIIRQHNGSTRTRDEGTMGLFSIYLPLISTTNKRRDLWNHETLRSNDDVEAVTRPSTMGGSAY